jgi:hypothetical protein
MEIKYELIESYQEVIENVRQFNEDLIAGEDICSQLAMFRAWYYIPEIDALGPSKFIGYKGMDTTRYQRGYRKDGKETEPRLQKFFKRIPKENTRYVNIINKLHSMITKYNKKPNKVARLNVPLNYH